MSEPKSLSSTLIKRLAKEKKELKAELAKERGLLQGFREETDKIINNLEAERNHWKAEAVRHDVAELAEYKLMAQGVISGLFRERTFLEDKLNAIKRICVGENT